MDRHPAEPPAAGSFPLWLGVGLVTYAILTSGCTAFYPPNNTRWKPEPRGTKTVEELMAEPVELPASASSPRFELTVYPRVVMAGRGAVRLTCRVPRDPDNRRLAVGFPNWQMFQKDMEGADAPVTYQWLYEGVGCGLEDPVCLVTRADGSVRSATVAITVAGCDPTG